MAKQRRYPPEFRRRVVELIASGRNAGSVAREFEVSREAIINWLKQVDIDAGRRTDGLTSEEREELVRLRRENKWLKMEQENLSKAAAWFALETNSVPNKSSDS